MVTEMALFHKLTISQRAFYYVQEGSIVVKYGDVEALEIVGGTSDSFIGEVSVFSPERNFYGNATARGDTRLIAVKVNDMLPLLLHDHKAACKMMEKLGGLLFARLVLFDQITANPAHKNNMKEDREDFSKFRKDLTVAWALKYHTVSSF